MTTKMNNNSKNVTKVVCQNCGAEIIIPKHESVVTGVAIGQDSELGTVILPTKNHGCNQAKSNPVDSLSSLLDDNAGAFNKIIDLIGKIEESGYLDVDGIVRRWIPSQCLQMLNCKEGFHDNLKKRGYDYSWKVLLDDLRAQCKMLCKKDVAGYEDRNRWYNADVAFEMANDYIYYLREYVYREAKRYKHEGRPYIKLKCWMNDGKGVHVDEFCKVDKRLTDAAKDIKMSAGKPSKLLQAVFAFERVRCSIKFTPKEGMSAGFINAYKAAGAYYTIKDLIMFENCLLKADENDRTDNPNYWEVTHGRKFGFVDKERSLKVLESKSLEILDEGVTESGYKMLGLLKDFLYYNKFDFEATKNKWAERKELRKAMMNIGRLSRRSRK